MEQRMLAAAVAAMQGGIALRAWRAWRHYAETRVEQRALLLSAVTALTKSQLFRAFGAWQVTLFLHMTLRDRVTIHFSSFRT